MANGSLTFVAVLACGLAAASPAMAAQECQLCAAPAAAAKKPPPAPIIIQIETRIDFSKIGLVQLNQGGTAQINAATGARTLTGNLIDLGGVPIAGTVLVRGEPKGMVTVTFPATVQLTNASGASYPLNGFTTTLKNNPKLEDDGTLRFTFGGLLQIDGRSTGTFRGSVPIIVEYK
jgi:hypothetical protein